jgi:hypothetical protein
MYMDRKDEIRAELLRLACEGKTIFYADLGLKLGIPARGPWKPVLDESSREETARGLPDITFLVINKVTGLPGQIDFKPAKPPTLGQREMANEMIRQVFAHYRPNDHPI